MVKGKDLNLCASFGIEKWDNQKNFKHKNVAVR